MAFVFYSCLTTQGKKKAKKPHSKAVKKGAKKTTHKPKAYKKKAQKKEGGFAIPFILFFSFYVFRVSRSIGTGYFIRF